MASREEVRIFYGSCQAILTECLCMRRVPGKLVPSHPIIIYSGVLIISGERHKLMNRLTAITVCIKSYILFYYKSAACFDTYKVIFLRFLHGHQLSLIECNTQRQFFDVSWQIIKLFLSRVFSALPEISFSLFPISTFFLDTFNDWSSLLINIFLQKKRSKREAEYSPPYSAEDMIAWNLTPTPHTSLYFGA